MPVPRCRAWISLALPLRPFGDPGVSFETRFHGAREQCAGCGACVPPRPAQRGEAGVRGNGLFDSDLVVPRHEEMQDGRQTDSRQSTHALPEAPFAAAGHFLERGLSVRSGCGAQGAAHALALWPAGLEARVPGKIPARCRWHVALRGRAFPGARTFSPQRVRGAGRGACACPVACGLGSPRSRGPCSRLGISLERGLLVRSGCVAQGAAHALAQWPAGLEARVPGKIPTGKDAGGTLRRARGISPERGLSVRSGCVAQGAAHAPALRPAGLEARVPGGSARGWAFLRSADF